MKKVYMAILVILVVAIIFSPLIIGRLITGSRVQWGFSYITVEEIPELGLDVVRAEVISYSSESPRAYTLYTIRILEVFQGALQVGDETEMVQWGRRSIWNRDWISIRVEDDLVLLLGNYASPASIFAIYRLSRSVPSDVELDASIRLNPESSRSLAVDNLRITVEDLWNLRDD